MKILYLIDSLEGYGAEKSLVHIALNMEGFIPVFVHLYKGENLKSLLEENGVKVYSLNIPSEYSFNHALKMLYPIIEKENPTIIHSTLFRADMVARRLKRKFPYKILVGSFVSNSYGKYRYSQLSFFSKLKLFSIQLLDRFTAGKVDYFICNSIAIKNSNMKALGVPEEKIKVIYRGRNFYNECSAQKYLNSTIKKELNLETKKVFLNVGRLHKGKGQLDLLHAFKLLVKVKPHNVLLIAGEGALREKLIQTINELELDNSVHLLGYREDIDELFCISDYFVFPTYYEGLPGALIEAMFSKTPVIVSSIEENKECLPESGGLFFKPGDIKELSLKMEKSLEIDDWEERTNLAFENALNNFDIKIISKDYESFYKKILKNDS